MNRTKSFRRFQDRKHKNKIKSRFRNSYISNRGYDISPRELGILAKTPRWRFGHMLRSKRELDGPTRQELKAELEFKEYMKIFYDDS